MVAFVQPMWSESAYCIDIFSRFESCTVLTFVIRSVRRPCSTAPTEALSGFSRPSVLRSNHVPLPSTSATKAGAGQVLRRGPIHCYSSLPAAIVPDVYSMFPACVWISTFASLYASVVLFPLTLLPYEFFFCPVVRITLWQWLWG